MAGIYIHIPFCKTRCNYCDFYSATNTALTKPFTEALLHEIKLSKDYLQETVETIYFGGGTPSLLEINDIESVLKNISNHYTLSENLEITLEANPDDLNYKKLQDYKSVGINRLSIGIQSFHPDEIALMNRRHTAEQAISAVKDAAKSGFKNISIDLIYNLPEQDVEKFDQSLQKALALPLQHISSYHLTYEKGTSLYKSLMEKKIKQVSEEESNSLFHHLISVLKNNKFIHYEISNFALDGYFSKHNSSYWKGIPYLGMGPSAHSYNGESRQWNVADIHKYISSLKNNIVPFEIENLNRIQKANELIMTSLRTMWGLDLFAFKKLITQNELKDFTNNYQKQVQNGNIKIENSHLILTEKGIIISDYILAELFIEDENSSPKS